MGLFPYFAETIYDNYRRLAQQGDDLLVRRRFHSKIKRKPARRLATGRWLFLMLCFAALMPSALWAQSVEVASRKQLNATKLNGLRIDFDGQVDESAWAQAHWVGDFLQKEPEQGKVPDEKTEVAVMYDEEFLYIGARMHSDNPDDIGFELNRRDNPGNSEQIIISIDSYNDNRTCYDFGVSAAGVRTDRYHGTDNEYDRDLSFDPVWDARTHINGRGWTAEMRIPFSQLRFNNQEQQVWGINLNRWIPARNEDNFWVYVPRDETGWSSYFGDLVGIEGIAPSRRIELLPYAAGDGQFVSNDDDGNPFVGSSDLDSRFGADLKMGLGPNLTLDATINPDFGQVEADPAVVNLSAYETFFEEKRPFFIEGSQLFGNIGPTFFYSRRIGGSPHGDAGGDYVDSPDNTTILGAAKVTGRLSSGTSIAVLSALTSREKARVYDEATDTRDKVTIEPVTGYGIARFQQEFGADKSTAGLLLTALERDIDDGDPLAGSLRKGAYTGNGDWRLRFAGGKYEISGHAGFSHVAGDTTVMQSTQQSSAHYYQRPDADHVTYDPTRTSLTGWTGSVRVNKNAGKHWLWGGGVHAESPGLELNDAGILGTADDFEAWGNIRYRENTPGPIFRSYTTGLFTNNGWNFGGTTQYRNIEWWSNGTWRNYWSSEFFIGLETRSLYDNLTRGGPLMGGHQGWWMGAGTWTNFAKPTRYGIFLFTSQTEINAWQYEIELEFTTRAGRRW